MLYFAAINFDISRLEGIIYVVVAIAILEFFAWRGKKNAKDKYFDIYEYSTSEKLCLCSYKEKRRIYLKAKRQLLIAETAPFSILFSGLIAILSLITSIPINKEQLAQLREMTSINYPLCYLCIGVVTIIIVVPCVWYYIYYLRENILDYISVNMTVIFMKKRIMYVGYLLRVPRNIYQQSINIKDIDIHLKKDIYETYINFVKRYYRVFF